MICDQLVPTAASPKNDMLVGWPKLQSIRPTSSIFNTMDQTVLDGVNNELSRKYSCRLHANNITNSKDYQHIQIYTTLFPS
jgi:hypothetical protein